MTAIRRASTIPISKPSAPGGITAAGSANPDLETYRPAPGGVSADGSSSLAPSSSQIAQDTSIFGSAGSAVAGWIKRGFSGIDNRGGTARIASPGSQSGLNSLYQRFFGSSSTAANRGSSTSRGMLGGNSALLLIGGAVVVFALMK